MLFSGYQVLLSSFLSAIQKLVVAAQEQFAKTHAALSLASLISYEPMLIHTST